MDVAVQLSHSVDQLLKFVFFAYRCHFDHSIRQLSQEEQKWCHCRRKSSVCYGTTKQNHLLQFNASSEMSIDEIHQLLKALKTGIKSSQRLEVLKTVREAVDPV